MAIIKEEWKEKIKKSKYSSKDNSILYNYVLGPICDIILIVTPESLAPNLITLMGLLCNITLNVLCCYYGGFDNSKRLPNWVMHLSSILYFTYVQLDNIDGKQARKTGNGSFLGMIFDHQCDVLTTFIFTTALCMIVGVSDVYYFALLWFMTVITFYIITLESYYTDKIVMPFLNGASEGTIAACVIMTICGVIGQEPFFEFYDIPYIGNIRLNHLMVWIFFSIGAGLGVPSLLEFLYFQPGKRLEILYNTIDLWLICITTYITVTFNKSPFMQSYPHLAIFLFGFLFAKLMLHMHLAVLHKDGLPQFRKMFILNIILFLGVTFINNYYGQNVLNIDYLFYVLLPVNAINYLQMAIRTMFEMKELLNIPYIFFVKPKPKLKA